MFEIEKAVDQSKVVDEIIVQFIVLNSIHFQTINIRIVCHQVITNTIYLDEFF